MSVFDDIKAIAGGFGVTLRHMLRKPVTIQYPEEKRTPYPRFRARIVLTRDPDGGERCVACYLCSAACPVDCISMQSAEQADGRRYAADYEICKRDIMDLVYEKEDLLIDGCGKDDSYNFYKHAGIGVTQQRGEGLEESPPVDVRSLMP
jgi:NADH-quinone oxidoreductase subunit I